MKLRSLPSSVKICLRRSGYWLVSAERTSPTVPPVTDTASCLPVNWRSGVGIITFAISVNQLLFRRLGSFQIGHEAVGVIELPAADREHHKRMPRRGVLQISFRKIGIAIGMRMVDADQVHAALARLLLGGVQILRTQLVARVLRSVVGVLERDRFADQLAFVQVRADHGAAALVRISL